MIGLGTLGSWKYGINISRNLLLSVLLYLLWILLHCVNSKWVCPYTFGIGDLERKTPSSPHGHPLAWVLSSTFSPVAAISQSVGNVEGNGRIFLPSLGSLGVFTLVREHLMARRLPFLALSSPTIGGCSWRALLWPYAGATRTSKQGTPLMGKDAQLWVSVPLRARMLPLKHQCSSSRVPLSKGDLDKTPVLEQGWSGQRHQCSISTIIEQGWSKHKHQCSTSNTLSKGDLTKRHQCSLLNKGVLATDTSVPHINYSTNNWMTPDVVPTRTVHHRFLLLVKPSTLVMCSWCRDKITWRQTIEYIIETGFTVFEMN